MARQSMPEAKNVRSASLGLHTIGSPAILKLVLITTGTPVIFLKLSIKCQYLGLALFFTYLLIISFIFGLEGFPSIDLLPSALGPISSLPWNHPTILLSANFLAASLQTSSHFLHLATLHSLIKGSISSLEYSGPQ